MKPPPTPAPSSDAKRSAVSLRIAAWGLFILTAIVFGRICSHEFTWWDDDLTIHQNRRFDPPTIRDVLWYWSHADAGMYIPVVYTVWGLLAVIAYSQDPGQYGSHLNPAIYHYASLLAHIATVLMVFAILRRLFRKNWPAFAGAALYAVHPVQVETVAWATSLKEGLCGLFGMLSLWYYLRAVDDRYSPSLPLPVCRERVGVRAASARYLIQPSAQPPPGVPGEGAEMAPSRASGILHYSVAQPTSQLVSARIRRPALYATAAVMLLLAQLSNPLAVVIPPMAFVLDALVLRRAWRTAAAWAGPLAALAMIDAVICKLVQPGVVAPHVNWWIRPLVATDTLAFYISKLFFPLHLCTDYARRPDVALARGWLYWTWIIPAAVACAVLILGRRRPVVIAGVLIGLIGVGPLLGFIPFDLQQYSTPADRYLYLAMLGPALLIGAWFAAPRPEWQWSAWGIVIAVLAVRSFIQVGTWHDDRTLWEHTVAVSPDSFVAHSNLGADYNRLSDESGPSAKLYLARAMAEYSKAVHMNPSFFKAHENLAMSYVRVGLMDDAIAEMKETVRLGDRIYGPRDRAQSRVRLAAYLIQRNQAAEAVVYLNQAKKLDPSFPGLDVALAQAQLSAQTRPTTGP